MKRLNVTIAAVCAALLLLTARPSPAQAPKPPAADLLTPQERRKAAPDFTLADTTGQPLTLSAYKGKVVLSISGPRGVAGAKWKYRGTSNLTGEYRTRAWLSSACRWTKRAYRSLSHSCPKRRSNTRWSSGTKDWRVNTI